MSWRVSWRWGAAKSATSFGDEAAARKFADAMRRRGARCVLVFRVGGGPA